MAAFGGSWTFILLFFGVMVVWILLNVAAGRTFDPYPFILLNLVLSMLAALQAPVIMMSQNRQAAKDRLMAEQDYVVNIKAEEEVKSIMAHLEQQDEVMIDILRRIEAQHHVIMSKLELPQPDGTPAPA